MCISVINVPNVSITDFLYGQTELFSKSRHFRRKDENCSILPRPILPDFSNGVDNFSVVRMVPKSNLLQLVGV